MLSSFTTPPYDCMRKRINASSLHPSQSSTPIRYLVQVDKIREKKERVVSAHSLLNVDTEYVERISFECASPSEARREHVYLVFTESFLPVVIHLPVGRVLVSD